MKALNGTMWSGKMIRATIPLGKDPFVNTNLLPVGRGADGEERFWISSYNGNSGCIGVLITESGKERIYRFPLPHCGFYSAAPEDDDTLWLCGDLSRVVRLTLSTGATETYDTGAPSALVFQGMVLDPTSGMLFAAAFPPPTTSAFSFDYRNRKPAKVFREVCKEHYMRSSFPNGDGTFSCMLENPDVALLQWDPLSDTVEAVVLGEIAGRVPSPSQKSGYVKRLIDSDAGLRYFPHWGWYNPLTRTLATDGPIPEREMTWFARRGDEAWGVTSDFQSAVVAVWDMASGRVSERCRIPDASINSVNLTSSGRIVALNLYGEYYRFDGKSGALEMSKRLPTESVGYVDCLCRIDERRLLGTPFITQRFWEIDLATGIGTDCGRAAPGHGEVLQTWRAGSKVYMAAYTGGELVEYDPEKPSRFPENPRVVADPPGGMRPVAAAEDGRHLYYSCNHDYGILGCVLTKYDTVSGISSYYDDPVPGQSIRSLWHDSGTRSLVAGTTMEADCQSCTPTSELCYFALIDDNELAMIENRSAPVGTQMAEVNGPMGQGRYLCTVTGNYGGHCQTRWFVLSASDFSIPELEAMEIVPDNMRKLLATGKPGLFIVQVEDRFELWDMAKQQRLQLLYRDASVYHFHVQENSAYFVTPKEVIILENCLDEFGSV